jgi:S1-C subfamily serine protease
MKNLVPHAQVQLEDTEQKYYESIVQLRTQPVPPATDTIQATGWAPTKDYIITAGHFCQGLNKNIEEKKAKADIRMFRALHDGLKLETLQAIILEISKDHDLCILLAPNHGIKVLQIMADMDHLETEDRIVVIGSPVGFFPVRRSGHIISTTSPQFEWKNLLFLEIDIQKGNSGSPVIWNGYVVGVVVILPEALHNSGLAVRGDNLLSFINEYIKLEGVDLK